MANHVLFVGWNRAVAGREAAAMENFTSFMGWAGKQVAAGNLESVEPVILNPHGGDLNGFVLLRGDTAKLHQVQQTDEFKDLVTRCVYNVDGFGMIQGVIGEELGATMGRWNKVITK